MDVEELLKDVLAVGRDAGFNRVRYIGQLMSQEEQAEFLKGLFNQAVLAREAKSGEALFDYLEQWEEKGMAIVAGRAQSPIELDATPWTPLRVPIREAKLALVTTGGFYLKSQQPYETDGPENLGDWSFRAIPRTASADDMDVGPHPLRPLRPPRGPQLRFPPSTAPRRCTPRASSAASTTPTTPSWASSRSPTSSRPRPHRRSRGC